MSEQTEVLKLYMVDDSFIQDIHDNLNQHVFSNVNPGYNHTRKYLGVLLAINGFSYYAPLSSPKNSDFIDVKGHRVIRNSILPIIRMVETDENGQRHLLGTIKLGNMIPVPAEKLIDYNLDNEPDSDYKDLVLKEKRFINRNKEMITSFAEKLYNEKCGTTAIEKGYLKNTFDFKAFEDYTKRHYCLHKEQ